MKKLGGSIKLKRVLLSAVALLASAQFAAAQNFNQTIVFGDSTVDTGFYALTSTGKPTQDAAIAAAIAAGGNAHYADPGGPNFAQMLAAMFGTTAITNKAPGGTNYAIGGALAGGTLDAILGPGHENFATLAPPDAGPNPNLLGVAEQITEYLTQNGGSANPNGLYLISTGGNTGLTVTVGPLLVPGLFSAPGSANAFVSAEAQNMANGIAQLQAAGARYIVVGNEYALPAGVFPPAQNTTVASFEAQTWADLGAAHVNFVPADTASVIAAVEANPGEFGITAPINSPACVISPTLAAATGMKSGYGVYCAPTTTPNPAYGNLVSADAEQTHLFVDNVHLTYAGNLILSDYIYSLLAAPSEISYLAEAPIQTTLSMIYGIQQQIDLSQQRPAGWNAWVNGDLSYLRINNSFAGLPNDPGTPVSGSMGADYHWSNGWMIGGAITEGYVTPSFSLGGEYTQNIATLSLYTAYRNRDWWGNLIGSYGFLHNTTNRQVPIGITVQPNNGTTNGSDLSLAGEVGYDFHGGFITYGPVGGFILQRAFIDNFTESGSFTSLSFANQIRNSEVSVLGFQAHTDWGIWHPFAQVTWDHEFDALDRQVTASLTTTVAPSFSLPAVVVSRDWATGTIGTQVKLSQSWSGLASFNAELGQRHVTNYGGLVGLNYAFAQAPPVSPLVYKN